LKLFFKNFFGAESIVPFERLLLAYTKAAGRAKSTRLEPPLFLLE